MLIRQPLHIGDVGELDPWSHHCVGSDREAVRSFSVLVPRVH